MTAAAEPTSLESRVSDLEQFREDFDDNVATKLETRVGTLRAEIEGMLADLESAQGELKEALTLVERAAAQAQKTAEDGVKRANNAQTTANAAGADLRAGKLGKLDVAEEFNAVVRCADFRMGHSSRHGGVGRALVDNGQTLTLNYGPDWKDGVDVKGELRARLWISEEFQWKQGEPDVKMCHSDDCFAFLTHVQGSFAGGGEKVRVYIGKDDYWYLGGTSLQQSVLARARCVGRPR